MDEADVSHLHRDVNARKHAWRGIHVSTYFQFAVRLSRVPRPRLAYAGPSLPLSHPLSLLLSSPASLDAPQDHTATGNTRCTRAPLGTLSEFAALGSHVVCVSGRVHGNVTSIQ